MLKVYVYLFNRTKPDGNHRGRLTFELNSGDQLSDLMTLAIDN